MTKILFLSVVAALVAAAAAAVTMPAWTYSQTDQQWADLVASDGTKPYAACVGTRQTPVDMRDLVVDDALKPLGAAWSAFSKYTVKNNGHTIQVDTQDTTPPRFTDPNTGIGYNLVQFHFHSPSEHTWGGAYRDLEVHLVHKDDTGTQLLVVGISFIASPYGVNSFLNQFWQQVLSLKTSGAVSGSLSNLNFKDALPSSGEYATYAGSLTTPPCSEIVTWYVMQDFITISNEQLDALRQALGFVANSKTTFTVDGNARGLQKLNGRVIRRFVGNGDAPETGVKSTAGKIAVAAIVIGCVALAIAVIVLVLRCVSPRRTAQKEPAAG